MNANFGPDYIQQGGIKVYTTLDWGMQQAADKAVDDMISSNDLNATQGALVALDPHTGYIRAMVGGVDYSQSQFNIAADGRRQPGSSFKPIIYTAAIDSGLITEDTPILDAPVSFPGGNGMWSPHNDDDRFRGWITAKTAMAMSVNVPAVKVLNLVGVDTAIRYAQMMGVTSPLAPYLTLALGASGCTPLEMACAYATIDNLGLRPSALCVRQIVSEKGDVLYTANTSLETTPISRDAFTQVKDMMHAVTTVGTAAALFRDGSFPDACGKTGTTQSHRDVWYNGFTNDMVCTVWAGHPSTDSKGHNLYGEPMSHYAFGSTICAPIWKQFMLAAAPMVARDKAADAKNQPPPPAASADNGDDNDNNDSGDDGDDTDTHPARHRPRHSNDGGANGQVSVWIDNRTGDRVSPGSAHAHQEQFTSGTEPSMSNGDNGDNGDNGTDNGGNNDTGTGNGGADNNGNTDSGDQGSRNGAGAGNGSGNGNAGGNANNGGSVQPDTGGGGAGGGQDNGNGKPTSHHDDTQ
jgi:membrane peptidoglycan carboxypeptidase